jgi:tetratricopeptide (TPR) repeat protein
VFVREGTDDAFSDCPNCQSMALAIGDASPEEASTLASAPAAVPAATQQGEPAASGVFSGLLSESTGGGPLPDVTADDLTVPATLEGLDARPSAEVDFGENTLASELPASLALTRASVEGAAVSDEPAPDAGFDPFAGVDVASDEEDIHVAPTHVLRPESQATEVLENPFAAGELEDAFAASGEEDEWENGPPMPSAPTSLEADENAWDNGPPSDVSAASDDDDDDEDAWNNGPPPSALPRPPPSAPVDVPSRPPSMAITHDPQTAGGAAVPAPAFDSGFFPSPSTDAGAVAAPLSGEEFNVAVHEEQPQRPVGAAERQGVWDPAFQSGEMGQQPVLLDQIEGQMNGAISLDNPDAAGLADAFSQLEAAFDDASASPDAQPSAQDALRAAGALPQHSHMELQGLQGSSTGPSVPAPPSADEPPPMRRVRQRGHLTLSEEAKALAGIPIQPEAGSGNLALELTRAPPPPLRAAPEPAPPELAAQPPLVVDDHLAIAHDTHGEVTDPVPRRRAEGSAAVEEPAEPGMFSGFTVLRVLLIVFVFIALGTGVGVITAPPAQKGPLTTRQRAEAKFSRGNRFYEEKRFDDALGEYRGALSLDETYPPAHRAKAAVLAKLKRHPEAARAYAKYLQVEPAAHDASEVREVLARWEGK